MKVEMIFTYENAPQDMGSALVNNEQLDDKKKFFELITACLDDEEKATLVKISCALQGASIPSPNHWYLESNGKFWDDEIPQLMFEVWGIESIITPINV